METSENPFLAILVPRPKLGGRPPLWGPPELGPGDEDDDERDQQSRTHSTMALGTRLRDQWNEIAI
jgi:hypothetical protein